jgi:site-specific recombinase XerD
MTVVSCDQDLRRFSAWCRLRSLPLSSVRRAGIETFARELEAKGRARATVTRRLCTIAGFYNLTFITGSRLAWAQSCGLQVCGRRPVNLRTTEVE